jgi:hypothetical protein
LIFKTNKIYVNIYYTINVIVFLYYFPTMRKDKSINYHNYGYQYLLLYEIIEIIYVLLVIMIMKMALSLDIINHMDFMMFLFYRNCKQNYDLYQHLCLIIFCIFNLCIYSYFYEHYYLYLCCHYYYY